MRLASVAVESVLDDRDTFEAVYAAQYVALVRLAYVTTGSVPIAEEVVQEVFVEWLGRLDEVHNPVPYLRRAVVSRCTSWLRRQLLERRHAGEDLTEPTTHGGLPEPAVAVVRAALRRLRPRQRAAVFLRFYLDLSEVEISEALGCRPGTVKSLLNRSLTTLREHLDEC